MARTLGIAGIQMQVAWGVDNSDAMMVNLNRVAAPFSLGGYRYYSANFVSAELISISRNRFQIRNPEKISRVGPKRKEMADPRLFL